MNEDLLASAVTDWLQVTDAPAPDPAGSRSRAVARARETRQARSWLATVAIRLGDRPRTLAGSGATAAVLVLVLGLAFLLPRAPTDDAGGGLADASARPEASSGTIHWQTDVVDLRADDFRLDVSDLTFTTRGSPLVVGSDPGDERYWTLEVEWREHDVEQRLNWYFAADAQHWWVTEMRTYDGRVTGEWVQAYGTFFRTPLGDTFEGDVRQRLVGFGRPEDPNEIVEAALAIDGLRLSVSPRERATRTGDAPPGATELIADVLRSARGALFPQPEPTPTPTERPDPLWAVEFGDLTLTGELVDEGVLRVTGDGTANRFNPIVSVAIADDGTVWLARRKAILALGRPGEIRAEDGGPQRSIERIEANDDGSLTVHADGVWRLEDGNWSIVESSAPSPSCIGVSPDGRALGRDEDGATWVIADPRYPDDEPGARTPGDAWYVRAGDAWVSCRADDVFPATSAQYPEDAFAERMLATPSGEIWAYNKHALSRFDGDAWEETSAETLADLVGGPVVVREALVGPDGVLWVLATGQDRETNPDTIQRLLRVAEGTWGVTELEGVLPADGRARHFYGLDSADEEGVWLMDRDGRADYHVGPGGLTQVSRWTPRDAVEAADGSVFGTTRPRSEGLLLVPAGEIRLLDQDASD